MIDAYFLIFANTNQDEYILLKTTNEMTLGLWNVIAFLNMLLTPEKPTTIIMGVTNLIIKS